MARKKSSIKSLRSKLDRVFSEFIRKRDADENGFGHCVTCGQFALLQCGHFIKRQHMALRYSEINCHGQCVRCNKWLHGNDGEYAAYLMKRYGQLMLIRLLEAKRKTVKYTRADYERMIGEFSR